MKASNEILEAIRAGFELGKEQELGIALDDAYAEVSRLQAELDRANKRIGIQAINLEGYTQEPTIGWLRLWNLRCEVEVRVLENQQLRAEVSQLRAKLARSSAQ